MKKSNRRRHKKETFANGCDLRVIERYTWRRSHDMWRHSVASAHMMDAIPDNIVHQIQRASNGFGSFHSGGVRLHCGYKQFHRSATNA